jgi:N,N'-diacetyllegionaminate synthase|tara:strand:- start:3640 stop:4647 length:1008 start_codon:yes stop_codon:yes gene_type:complete
MENKVLIIAEIGVNHNGKIDLAFELINVASESGADIVKLQTSIPNLVTSRYAPKADYQLSSTESRETLLEMCNKLNLSFEDTRTLKLYAEKKDIKFLSTPFDIVSIDFLNKLGLDCFKIPSGEINNLPYLREIGRLNKKVIMSTGMSELSEVRDAIQILITSGTEKTKITVLHCNTEYPTPYEDVNLKAMVTMRDELGVQVGYSDHTLGIEVPIAAVALGATVIEKHITLDRAMQGPDHRSSLQPKELKAMVHAIRNIEKSLGDGIKRPSPSEQKNISVARKSIVAAGSIKKGEIFSEKNLLVKRPGIGISPKSWNEVIGTAANKDYEEDDLIEL